MDEPPVCTMVTMPCFFAQAIIGRVVVRRLDRAEAGLGEPYALGGELVESPPR